MRCSWLLPLAAARCAAASGSAATCVGAARSEADADGQQECEHASMRLQALQTGSVLAGARTPGGKMRAKPMGPKDLDMREVTGYAEGNPYVPGPNVYLKEMVDASNYWGWCLDISESPPRPVCEKVQGHSCKTTGEDTQFLYDPKLQELRSVNFNSMCQPLYSGSNDIETWNAATEHLTMGCLQVDGDVVAGATLRMVACRGAQHQKFNYTAKGQFAVGDGSLCLVLGTGKQSLPDMMMRSAEIQSCDSWPAQLSVWEVLLEDHTRLSPVE